MDKRLTHILESLLRHSQVFNQEVQRLERTEQFNPTAHCFQLIESIREEAMCTLQTARSIERQLHRQQACIEAEKKVVVYTLMDGIVLAEG